MSAMKLISAVKLQRAQNLLLSYRPYSDAYEGIAKSLATRCDPEWHPLLKRPEESKKLHLVFMTSDRGLCGSFNSNIIRKIDTFLVTDAKKYELVKLSFLGRRGRDHFARREFQVSNSFIGITEKNITSIAKEISTEVTEEFIKGEVDEVMLVYNYFKSAISHVITFKKLLPLEQEETDEENTPIDYLYEPNRKDVLDYVLPKYLEVSMERAIFESATSEQAARMTAMENATRNADEVLRKLTLLFNKTRQAQITRELMDIVNGTEALRKGGSE
ncbi:ATP synthase F1 subunit gamma [Desulfobacterota bacterium AH_259_B03_O07]|nr:ATP synthase F1 subunit gamma [Desulfobacterota bacterium AH_259_B03_O07]